MDRPIARRVCRHLGFLLVVIAWVSTPASAQTVQGVVPQPLQVQGQPPRDRQPSPPRVGTAVIRGRVVDGVTGNPVARARVRLMSGPAGLKPAVLTDSMGAFEFTALPQGPCSLMVEKSTYLPGRYPEVTRSVRARMQPLMLRDGQVVEDLSIALFHGAAIAGRVLDAYGDPVDAAQVRVLRVPRGDRPTTAGQTQTNDLGEFRVPRLQPGRYLIQVRPQMNQNYQDPNVVEAPLPQPLPTYYPNARALSEAQLVTLNRGETMAGLEMMLADGLPTVVTGVVLRSDGEPVAGGSVSARVTGSEAWGGFDMSGGTGLRQGGMFRLTLPPGEFVLQAEVMIRQGPGPMGPDDQMFGTTRISVGGGSTEAVTITVGRGATASGRIVFEGSTPPPPSPGQAHAPLYNPDGPGCHSAQAMIAADWTFKIEGLNGTCSAPPQRMFGRWTLKAVTFRGQSLLDEPLTFETGQQYTNVQIVVTDKRTQMDLRVSGDDGQPTREYVALAFPLDKAKWTGPVRLIRTYVPPPIGAMSTGLDARTAGTGVAPIGPAVGAPLQTSTNMAGLQERITGLPAGEYYVIALDDIEAEDTLDPGVLERLTSNAIRVTLTDEAPTEVPLRRFMLADVMR